MNDNYSAPSGGSIYAGMNAPDSLEIVGIAQGGTVSNLAANVSSAGFTLLSTSPAVSIFRNNAHSGGAWDEERKAFWFFGAETHNIAIEYDNSVYAFDTCDGLFKKMNSQDPYIGEYCINTEGYLFADNAETRPWACHTYQRMRYNSNRTITIAMDVGFHSVTAGGLALKKGAIDYEGRKKSLLVYDTTSKSWTFPHSAGVQSFLNFEPINGVAFHPTLGMYTHSGSQFKRLANDLTYSTVGIASPNVQYHDSAFFIGNVFYKFCGTGMGTGGNFAPYLFSSVDATATSVKSDRLVSDYAAIAGWSVRNKAATLMPDNRVLFLAQNGNQIGAFIYNPSNDTVTDTGHRTTTSLTDAIYNHKLAWSTSLNGAVWVGMASQGNPVGIYLIKI